ncbi:malate permease and related proteins [Aerococcus sp. 150760007-1]|uniref:AEC family malonate efflux carrier n=3 Tax=Aerococcus TaxID=1375 RepID=A0AAU8U258_9LACT|nr:MULTISPECIES: AEC family transporter [Aerococcus]AMC00389.1 AEC family malonate efflux carrier [Aerococcus viridans]EFG49177.1 transporter, auxin efflux carrier (AEC) family protein [Aerococcus viridans ATCC 11563 = CCUG 4311]MBA5746267.1 AEC family transporter [Aerococcus urinaeequi]MBA5829051.1 AEC family transporter [Aerococcus urinaeequi]MBA5859955.1 AEC family transporter [Aerococcus urinaeequi]
MFSNFMIGFNAVMPMLIYMLFGQFFAQAGMIKQESFQDFNKALFKILLPINLFTNIYKSDFKQSFNGYALTYIFVIALILYFMLAFIIPRVSNDRTRYGVMLQGSVRANAILFGLPLGTSLLGEENLGMVTITLAIIVPFWNIMSVVGFSLYSEDKVSFKQMGRSIITNPMVIATFIGLIVILLGLQFPEAINTSLTNINRMVSPLALMVMGGTFSFKLKDVDFALIFTVANKLIIIPLIAITLGAILGFRGDAIVSILIAFAGPTAVSSYAQAIAADGDGDLANQTVVFTTIFSMITLVFLIALMKTFGLF